MYRERKTPLAAHGTLGIIKINDNLWLIPSVCKQGGGVPLFAPFYRHSFPVFQTHFQADREKLNLLSKEDKPPENLGERLKYFRCQKGLLQREVAQQVGVSRSCYHGWEHGGNVSEHLLERTWEVLGVE